MWLKLSNFLWLVARGSLLTWYHIIRRQYRGPLICYIFQAKSQIIEHILNLFPFTLDLRDKGASRFQQLDMNTNSVKEIIVNWRMHVFHNLILNMSGQFVTTCLVVLKTLQIDLIIQLTIIP